MLLDAATLPSDGAVLPKACTPIPAGGVASISYPGASAQFLNGIIVVVSSANTCFTKTTGTLNAFLSGQVQ
jgi:hypothetical protein